MKKVLRVLMFGWEFPPVKSGGLGTACFGLTQGLSQQEVDITFVIPHVYSDHRSDTIQLEGMFDRYSENVTFKKVESIIQPYQTVVEYETEYSRQVVRKGVSNKKDAIYSTNLYEEVERYAFMATELVKDVACDIIHAHDWMTIKAGLVA